MKKWMTKTDAVLLLILVFFSLGWIGFKQISPQKNEDLTAVVTVDGAIEATIDLTKISKPEIRTLSNGIELYIEHGAISFQSSDCHDKICVRSGKLSHSGDVAACVPNQTVVTLQSSQQEEVDGLAY